MEQWQVVQWEVRIGAPRLILSSIYASSLNLIELPGGHSKLSHTALSAPWMPFETVFDVSQSGFRAWWAFFPFAGVAFIGLILSTAMRRLGWILCIAGLGFGLFFQLFAYTDYRRLKSALEEGRFTVVKGEVVDFIAGGADGHPAESFCVTWHCYAYTPFMITAGFHQVSNRGGPIRSGKTVRIADVEGRIARLEVEAPKSGLRQ